MAYLIPDFSTWPDVHEWYFDETVPYGTYHYRTEDNDYGRYYASVRTLADLGQHKGLYDENGIAAAEAEAIPARMEKRREFVLDEAKGLVVGDRNAQYGEPYDDFKKVADALNAYGFQGPGGRKIMPRDVPFFQILVKLSRLIQSPTKMDSWVDAAGYAACGAEVAEVEAANND